MDTAAVATLAAELGCTPLLATLLWRRGVGDAAAARAFLAPALHGLGDPYAMRDAQGAADRLADAVQRHERVCVYGDYDVDGISAAALMHDALDRFGARPQVFLPDRIRDGYGLHADRIAELAAAGVTLFVSVDCGSTASEPIAAARAAGADFIIVDHHQLAADEPPANFHLNPRRQGCGFGAEPLAAVGVALVLAQAVRRTLQQRGHFGPAAPPALGDLLELAALGTIADMVPLRGLNRALAWHGLARLGQSARAGVQALAKQLRIHESAPDAHRVGFLLGPRLNAAGRVGDAARAFELLTTADPARAQALAAFLEVENNRRKGLQAQAEQQALAAAQASTTRDHAVVVADAGWHPGVVGIVAARLKDALDVPTFVLALDGDTARGSGRSALGYDLVAGLRRLPSDLLTRFGGHAHAAGVTLPAAHVTAFAAALAADVAATVPLAGRSRPLDVDAEVAVEAIDLALVAELERLEPCGTGNPRPLLLVPNAVVGAMRVLGEGAWVRVKLVEDSDRPLWGRRGVDAFGKASLFADVRAGDKLDVVATLQRNVHNGVHAPQLSPIAIRGSAERRDGEP